MMRLSLLIAMVFALVACGGDDKSAPEQAMENYIDIFLKQQGGRAYDWIVPEQAAKINRDLFIQCYQEGDTPDLDVEAIDSYTEPLDVAEVGNIETWAITVKLGEGDNTQNQTRHLIERDGDFFTFYDADILSTYESGECP